MNYIFALVVLLSLADIIGASRQRDRDVQQRSRPDTPPNVRAFDGKRCRKCVCVCVHARVCTTRVKSLLWDKARPASSTYLGQLD